MTAISPKYQEYKMPKKVALPIVLSGLKSIKGETELNQRRYFKNTGKIPH